MFTIPNFLYPTLRFLLAGYTTSGPCFRPQRTSASALPNKGETNTKHAQTVRRRFRADSNVFDRDQGVPKWTPPGRVSGSSGCFGQRVKTSYITSTKIFTPFLKLGRASILQQVSGSCWVMQTFCQASTQWADRRAVAVPPWQTLISTHQFFSRTTQDLISLKRSQQPRKLEGYLRWRHLHPSLHPFNLTLHELIGRFLKHH